MKWPDGQGVLRIIVKPTRNDIEYCYPVRKREKEKEKEKENQEVTIRFEKSFRYKSLFDSEECLKISEV